MFQRDSALAQWYRARTADARGATRKTMIVALARKLLVALWQQVTVHVPQGVVLPCSGVSNRPGRRLLTNGFGAASHEQPRR
jgi:hypothetical protein